MTGPTTFRARGPEDLVALVPILLGFEPSRSIAMLTFGAEGGHSFRARVDVPERVEHCEEVVEVLLTPAVRHRVSRVAFVVYAEEDDVVDELAWDLPLAFGQEGIEVIAVLRAHDGRWHRLDPAATWEGAERRRTVVGGTRFDPENHPFRAQMVLQGRVVLPSREDLRRTVEPDPVAIERTRRALGLGEPGSLPGGRVVELVEQCVAAGRACTTAELLGVSASACQGSVRDQLWRRLTREKAAAWIDFWRDVVRWLPPDRVAPCAAVLAMIAWLAGDGALAWCAVDRCEEALPGHPLASLVAELLEQAVAPDTFLELLEPGAA